MEIQRQRQKLEDFKQLKRDYDSYESNREVLEKCKKEEARYQARYAAYENAEQNFHIDESLSADQMEARYEAITSVLSQ